MLYFMLTSVFPPGVTYKYRLSTLHRLMDEWEEKGSPQNA